MNSSFSRAGHNWPGTTGRPSGGGRYNRPSAAGFVGGGCGAFDPMSSVWLPESAQKLAVTIICLEREIEELEVAVLTLRRAEGEDPVGISKEKIQKKRDFRQRIVDASKTVNSDQAAMAFMDEMTKYVGTTLMELAAVSASASSLLERKGCSGHQAEEQRASRELVMQLVTKDASAAQGRTER